MYDFDGIAKDDAERLERERIAFEMDHPNRQDDARQRKAAENKFRREYYGLNKPNDGGHVSDESAANRR